MNKFKRLLYLFSAVVLVCGFCVMSAAAAEPGVEYRYEYAPGVSWFYRNGMVCLQNAKMNTDDGAFVLEDYILSGNPDINDDNRIDVYDAGYLQNVLDGAPAFVDNIGRAEVRDNYFRCNLFQDRGLANSDLTSWPNVVSTYTHKLIYDANGGTLSDGLISQTVEYVTAAEWTFTISDIEPVLDGFVFLGWSTDAGASAADYRPNDTITGHDVITLYAIWQRDESISMFETGFAGGYPSSFEFRDLAYGDGRWVLPGWDRRYLGFEELSKGAFSAESSDGKSWSNNTMPETMPGSICYGDGMFVTVPYMCWIDDTATSYYKQLFGYDTAYTSDGITWNSGRMPRRAFWNDVAYGNNVYVAVASGVSNGPSSSVSFTPSTVATDVYAYSTNGKSWFSGKLPAALKWNQVAYGGNVFLAAGTTDGGGSTSICAFSADGKNWTQSALPFTSSSTHLVSSPEKIVVCPLGSAISGCYVTNDGIHFESVSFVNSATGEPVSVCNISYSDGMYSGFYDGVVYLSDDCVHWDAYPIPADEAFAAWSVKSSMVPNAYGNGYVVCVMMKNSNEKPYGFNWLRMRVPNYTNSLTYDAAGAFDVPNSETWDCKTGHVEGYVSNVIPSINNDTFAGWSTDPAATSPEYYPGDSISVCGNMTLYAVWESKLLYDHSLTYSAAGAVSVPDAESYSVHSADGLTVTVSDEILISTETGYTFIGWSTDANVETVEYYPGDSIVVCGDVVLYAVWEKAVYTVTVSTSSETYGSVSGGGQYTIGSSCSVTATPVSGYAFAGWQEDGNIVSTSVEYKFIVTGDRTLTALFSLPGGYTKVEYIETVSGQNHYFDTGLYAYNGNHVVLDFAPLSANTTTQNQYVLYSSSNTLVSGKRRYFNCNVTWNKNSSGISGSIGWAYGTPASVALDSDGTARRMLMDVDLLNRTVTLDGGAAVSCASSNAGLPSTSLRILGSTSAALALPARLYSCQITNSSGELVRDLIPCKNASGVAGLYDLVYGTFYTAGSNSNTVIAGPVL